MMHYAAALVVIAALAGCSGDDGTESAVSSSSAPTLPGVSSSTPEATDFSAGSIFSDIAAVDIDTRATLAAIGNLIAEDVSSTIVDMTRRIETVAAAPFLGYDLPSLPGVSTTRIIDCPEGGTVTADLSVLPAVALTFAQCGQAGAVLNGLLDAQNILYDPSGSASGDFAFSHFTRDDGITYLLLDGTIHAAVERSGDTLAAYSALINGLLEITLNEALQHYTFTEYRADFTGDALRLNGGVSIHNVPERCGGNGDYAISTTRPITLDDSGRITGGELVVNGSVFTYHGDGSVTAGSATILPSDLAQCAF